MSQVDRGWAWVIVFGMFANYMIIVGTIRSFGLVFVGLIEYYDASASLTAVLFSIAGSISMFGAPIISGFTEITSCRTVAICGAVLCCVALTICSYAGSLMQIVFTYGIMMGLGTGMVLVPGPVMVATYFDKRRSLANGLAFAGSGVGGFIMPHIIAQLIKEYHLHGSLLLLAGICLNSAVLSALFRPFEHEKEKPEKYVAVETKETVTPVVPPLNIAESNGSHSPVVFAKPYDMGLAYRNKRSYSEDVKVKKISASHDTFEAARSDRFLRPGRFLSVTHVPAEPMDGDERHRHICRSHPNCHHQDASLSTWNFSINTVSTMDLPIATEFCVPLEPVEESSAFDEEDKPITEELKAFLEEEKKLKCAAFPVWKRLFYFRNPVTKELSPFIDFAFFKNIRFLLFCIGSALNINYFWVNMITAPRCKQLGLSLDDIALLASVFAASDTAGRLLCGFVGDGKWLKHHRMSCLIGFSVLGGGITCCNALTDSFWMMMGYMLVCPIFFGGITTFTPVVLGDIVGRQHMAKAWGLMLFFEGFSVVISPVLLGYIADRSGSWHWGYVYVGLLIVLSGVVMLIVAIMSPKGSDSDCKSNGFKEPVDPEKEKTEV